MEGQITTLGCHDKARLTLESSRPDVKCLYSLPSQLTRACNPFRGIKMDSEGLSVQLGSPNGPSGRQVYSHIFLLRGIYVRDQAEKKHAFFTHSPNMSAKKDQHTLEKLQP